MGDDAKARMREFFLGGNHARRLEAQHHLKNAHRREMRKHCQGCTHSSDENDYGFDGYYYRYGNDYR